MDKVVSREVCLVSDECLPVVPTQNMSHTQSLTTMINNNNDNYYNNNYYNCSNNINKNNYYNKINNIKTTNLFFVIELRVGSCMWSLKKGALKDRKITNFVWITFTTHKRTFYRGYRVKKWGKYSNEKRVCGRSDKKTDQKRAKKSLHTFFDNSDTPAPRPLPLLIFQACLSIHHIHSHSLANRRAHQRERNIATAHYTGHNTR